jgi:membrane-bound serine protease (ClpP class)
VKKIILLAIIAIQLFYTSAYCKTYYTITINSAITHYTYKYVENALKEAELKDGILLIKLDTPGGLLDATRKIVQLFLGAKVPIIVFVYPQGARAASAGTFLVLAANVAAMAEGTNIGAAFTINFTGKNIEDDLKKKIVQDTTAFIAAIAEKRKRNVTLAKKMVKEALSLKSSDALKGGIIDYIVNDEQSLISLVNDKYQYKKNFNIVELKRTKIEKIAFFLSDPNILVLLLLIGILCIFLEIKLPGTFVFAATGIVCFILFLFGINIIPINYLALLLIIAGISLIIAEVFIPSFGLLTLSSILALSFGMYLLFKREGNMGLNVSIPIMVLIILIIITVILTLGFIIFKDIKRKPVVGLEKFIDKTAVVLDWHNSKGKILIDGEIWNAISQNSLPLKKEDIVTIKGFKDMELYVEKN